MQVQRFQHDSNNISFQRIKSIKCSGLYKNKPEYGKKLLDALKQNDTAMDFFKKYDVNIVFNAREAVNFDSSVHIFYDNPTIGIFKKFINFLSGSEDKISIHAWNSFYLERSTEGLIDMILPEWAGTRKSFNGTLSSHLRSVDESIQKVLDERVRMKTLKEQQRKKK